MQKAIEFRGGWPEWNDGTSFTNVITNSDLEANVTVLSFYTANYNSSAFQDGWKLRILNAQIELNGEIVQDPEAKLKQGDTLKYIRRPWREPPAPHHLTLLYEDDHVLIVSKPSGLQVMRGGLFHQRTVLTLLSQRECYESQNSGSSIETLRNMNVAKVPVPVHRLGRGTSGILMCAKSQEARKNLSIDFAAPANANRNAKRKSKGTNVGGPKGMSKIYRALCQGVIVENEVLVDAPIGRIDYSGVGEGLYMASPSGKHAQSRIRVLWRDLSAQQTLVEVDLYTGRAHQIRIHTAFIGHPLVGDPLYCSGGVPISFSQEIQDDGRLQKQDEEFQIMEDGGHSRPDYGLPGDCGYFLHAFKLNFRHPATNEDILVQSLPPQILWKPTEDEQAFQPFVENISAQRASTIL